MGTGLGGKNTCEKSLLNVTIFLSFPIFFCICYDTLIPENDLNTAIKPGKNQ